MRTAGAVGNYVFAVIGRQQAVKAEGNSRPLGTVRADGKSERGGKKEKDEKMEKGREKEARRSCWSREYSLLSRWSPALRMVLLVSLSSREGAPRLISDASLPVLGPTSRRSSDGIII